tara:strand:+ start:434 stop:865 length:432 start_codon:yes stop_codon:yes gene_type:complete
MKPVFCFIILVFFISCKDNANKAVKAEVIYDMYVPSEMSVLMKELYAFNLELKKQVVKEEDLTPFPEQFLNIHTAQLSDFKARTERFKSFSNIFLTAQKEIYNTNSDLSLKDRFNNTINTCISCHSLECTGPIPKIKKLLISQ